MILETDSYGEIEYETKDLITFPDGVFGFPDLKHYLLLSLSEGDNSILLMLSADQPEIVFCDYRSSGHLPGLFSCSNNSRIIFPECAG